MGTGFDKSWITSWKRVLNNFIGTPFTFSIQITIYTGPGCVTYNQPTSPKGERWMPEVLLQVYCSMLLFLCCVCLFPLFRSSHTTIGEHIA